MNLNAFSLLILTLATFAFLPIVLVGGFYLLPILVFGFLSLSLLLGATTLFATHLYRMVRSPLPMKSRKLKLINTNYDFIEETKTTEEVQHVKKCL